MIAFSSSTSILVVIACVQFAVDLHLSSTLTASEKDATDLAGMAACGAPGLALAQVGTWVGNGIRYEAGFKSNVKLGTEKLGEGLVKGSEDGGCL